jgi:hypothetical protein
MVDYKFTERKTLYNYPTDTVYIGHHRYLVNCDDDMYELLLIHLEHEHMHRALRKVIGKEECYLFDLLPPQISMRGIEKLKTKMYLLKPLDVLIKYKSIFSDDRYDSIMNYLLNRKEDSE